MEILSHFFCVLRKSLVFDNGQYFQPDSTGNWISAECIEVLHTIVESICQPLRCNYYAERMSITDRFTNGNNIRNYIVCLECPEVIANTPAAGLYFIGDANTAGTAHHVVNSFKVSRRTHYLS